VQFAEIEKVSVLDLDLDFDLGSGQGHISMRNTYRTTGTTVPDHVTVASSSTEIWPFESRVMSTFCEV